MHGLSDNFGDIESEVIVEALAKWCFETGYEPDAPLMSRAIDLYNRGNDTAEKLFEAIRKQLTQ
jgi:hypothetical protein